jgi:hypothetical protein
MKVYIASPYTGNEKAGVHAQMIAFDDLMNHGYTPFAPLLSHFQHQAFPRTYDEWIEYDLQWVRACDCVLRLEGESKGADMEVAFAKKHGIPVYYSIEELIKSK